MSRDAGINCTAAIDSVEIPWGTSSRDTVIAGYVLKERIGVGGYGEVWRAVGPGGLPKAVKILYGKHDGREAETEIKSLKHVRELRHPFLLSVERVEICDGRLIIVTELADGCLKDRFEEVQREGLKGIPRDELLAYLRDAADALDFMFERHRLQHLDIKPENLLLQGAHIKIGDFGLIKDIKHTGVSLVSGFTPLYAPPELFEGKPSPTSDQYSLAIVYQTMLTGEPPFAGRTAAQLTAQHLRSTPDLSALQPMDRPAIARALAKSPSARFTSCGQFVDDLTHRRAARRQPVGGRSSQSSPSHNAPQGTTTQLKDTHPSSNVAIAAPVTMPLPPVAIDPPAVSYRPIVFVGVGGFAGRILCALREQLCKRFGVEADLPCLSFLCIDTDQKALSVLEYHEGHSGLRGSEVLPIPLRDAKEYRAASHLHLEWMSRRWLLNIPRSRQVESIRPLGRLALVDHQQSVRDRLRELIVRACGDDAVRLTVEQTQLPFSAGPPDVFVIASISGGTGSGVVLDLAYLIRDAFADLNLEPGTLSGLLLDAFDSVHSACDVHRANTLSCLKELMHFSTPGLGYPGGLARQRAGANVRPFDQTYLIQVGGGLDDAGLTDDVETIGKYLYVNSVTPARAYFQKWRQPQQDPESIVAEEWALRTFGFVTIDGIPDQSSALAGYNLSRGLLRKWSGGSTVAAESSIALGQQTSALLSKLQLTEERVTAQVMAAVRGEPSKQIDAYFQAAWAQLRHKHGNQMPNRSDLFGLIAADFSQDAPRRMPVDAATPADIVRVIEEHLAIAARRAATSIRAVVVSLIDKSRHRIGGASAALADIVSQLDNVMATCAHMLGEIDNEYKRYVNTPSHAAAELCPDEQTAKSNIDVLRSECHKHCVLQFCGKIYQCFIDYVGAIRRATSGMGAELIALRRRLHELEDELKRSVEDQAALSAPRAEAVDLAQSSEVTQLPSESLVEAFDDRVRSGEKVRLSDLLGDDSQSVDMTSALLREAFDLLSEGEATRSPAEGPARGKKPTGPLWHAARPRLTSAGGGRRVLFVIPEECSPALWKRQLEREFGDCVSLGTGKSDELFGCCEVEGVMCEAVISQLISKNPHLVETADRLHTRIDIEW